MNIFGMTTVTAYTNTIKLNLKMDERKRKIEQENKEDPRVEEIKRWVAQQRVAQRLSAIHGKMMGGGVLSEDELDYLKTNSPEQYEKAIKIKKEREQYEKELKKCKSKEEVAKLNERKMTEFNVEAKNIMGNNGLPKAKKAEKLEFIMMRMTSIMNEHTEFQNSERYKNLPEKSKEKGTDGSGVEPIISWDELKPERQADPMDLFKESMEKLMAELEEYKRKLGAESEAEPQGAQQQDYSIGTTGTSSVDYSIDTTGASSVDYSIGVSDTSSFGYSGNTSGTVSADTSGGATGTVPGDSSGGISIVV